MQKLFLQQGNMPSPAPVYMLGTSQTASSFVKKDLKVLVGDTNHQHILAEKKRPMVRWDALGKTLPTAQVR